MNKLTAGAFLVLSLTACSTPPTKQQIGTATGAVVGGIVGSAVTGGSTVGTIGGAAAGGVVGNEIAKRMK
jgi:Predicted outer membrane lipoprotein